jgi:general secretion pathway protein D
VRRQKGRRGGSRFALVACVAVLLAACSSAIPISSDNTNSRDGDVFDKVRSIDLLPRFPRQVQQDQPSTGSRVRPVIYAGDDAPQLNLPRSQGAAGGEGYDLNFENTPVSAVAKVVLGDILGVGYIIDPRVQGTVSLASGRPIPKGDIVFVLENALRLSGVALVRDSTGYRLVPQADAVGAGSTDSPERTEPGYGISVVSLQYVSAQTILKLIDSFATRAGMVRADTGRNMILIQGTGSERRNAVDLVLSFDADWMRGQSVGIFPIQNSAPEPIIAELEKILDSGEGGLSQNLVKLQAINRMNAVLAVSRKQDVLRRIETWVRRLDNVDTGRTGVNVYRVKYGEAVHLARVLNNIFVGGAGAAGAFESPASQIAPGSGLSSSSSASASSRLSAAGSTPASGLGRSPPTAAGGFGDTRGGAAQGQLAPGGQAGNLFDVRGGGLFAGGASRAGGGAGAGAGGPGPVLEGVRITADPVNNTLLIYASQENFAIIERTLRQIDRPQLQVGIDATIAEVTLNDNLNYGVQFYLTSRNLGLPADRGSVLNTASPQPPAAATATSVAGAFINRAFPGFNFLVGPELQPNMILDALHTVTDVKVLSNPSVVVIDNQIATLQVGDEVPISTGSATVLTTNNTVVNTIDYRNTGIILRVVPRINANGNVRLDIEQEISNVPTTNAGAGTLTPTISQRKVRSSVAVASGQTVLLAGLVSERQAGGRSGIPVLDQIPGIGDVFSQTGKGVVRTELIIFIRPQIIRDSVDAHFVAEELRTKLRGTLGPFGAGQTALPKYR